MRRTHYTNALLALRELGSALAPEIERQLLIAKCEARRAQLQRRANKLYAAYSVRPDAETWQQTFARHQRIERNAARLQRLVERNEDRLRELL